MGHSSPEIARKLIEKGFVTGVKLEMMTPSGDSFFCESCVYTKAMQKPVAKTCESNCATEFGREVHSDLWGPSPVVMKGGKCYYITFTNDKMCLTHLHLLHEKSNTFEAYKKYEAWCETCLGAHVKILHLDQGGKYQGKEFILHLQMCGTEQKLTVHDTPQHNGVAECHNHMIVKCIHVLLHSSGLPRNLCGEAACHVVWLLNQMSMKAVRGTPKFQYSNSATHATLCNSCDSVQSST